MMRATCQRSTSTLLAAVAFLSVFSLLTSDLIAQYQQRSRELQDDYLLFSAVATIEMYPPSGKNEEKILENHHNRQKSFFDQAVEAGHTVLAESFLADSTHSNETALSPRRPKFDLPQWHHKTQGGLTNRDRLFLADIYRNAQSVFEYGLGESTYIANAVNVPYYAGVDSDAAWVAAAREKVNHNYRFYLGDIGATAHWGYPAERLAKGFVQYQLMPLQAEPFPFDVYMVDGRWRVPSVILCFLHASARRASTTIDQTTVLLHDCPLQGVTAPRMYQRRHRAIYDKLGTILHLANHSGDLLCAYQRPLNTTDEMLWDMWWQVRDDIE